MDESSKKPGLYETLAKISGKSPNSSIPASVIAQGKAPNSTIPGSILDKGKNAKSVTATANATFVKPDMHVERLQDILKWNADCPAIGVCEQVDNVHNFCQKGEPLPANGAFCVQSVLLLLARIHGLIPVSDPKQED